MPLASNSNSSGQVWRWAVRKRSPPALCPARICSESALLSQVLSSTSPHCRSQQQRCEWWGDKRTYTSYELFVLLTLYNRMLWQAVADRCTFRAPLLLRFNFHLPPLRQGESLVCNLLPFPKPDWDKALLWTLAEQRKHHCCIYMQ